jgi:hypothetical protein
MMRIRLTESLRGVAFASLLVACASASVACGGDDSGSGSSSGDNTSSSGGSSSGGSSSGGSSSGGSSSGGSSSGGSSSGGSSSGGSSSGGSSSGGQQQQAATPTFSPAAGPYTTGQTVTISSATPNATIYYTLDKTNPTTSSTVYSSPLSISTTTTIRAMAVAPGFDPSPVAVGDYTITIDKGNTAPVQFEPNSGENNTPIAVALKTDTSPSTICYTIDGVTAPTCDAQTGTCTGGSATYSAGSPIPIDAQPGSPSRTVKALACSAGNNNSDAKEVTYTFKVAKPTSNVADGIQPYNTHATFSTATPNSGGSNVQLFANTTTAGNPTCTNYDVAFTSGQQAVDIPITQNANYRVIGCKTGYAPSDVATFDYKVKLSKPTLDAKEYNNDHNPVVTVGANSPAGQLFCLTTDGKTPSCNAAKSACGTDSYAEGNAALLITSSPTTARVIACKAGYEDSDVMPGDYTLKVAKVKIAVAGVTLPAGVKPEDATFYDTTAANPSVTLSTDTTGTVEIRYTTDGTLPTACGTAIPGGGTTQVYGGPFLVTNPTSLRVIGCKPGGVVAQKYLPSDEHAATVADSSKQVTFTVSAGNTPVDEGNATGADPFDVAITNLAPITSLVCYTVGAAANPDCDAAGTACTTGTAYNPASKPKITKDGDYFSARACKAGLNKSLVHQFQYRQVVRRPTATIVPGSVGGVYPFGSTITFVQSTSTAGFPSADATTGKVTADVTYRYNVTTNGLQPADPTCAASDGTGSSFAFTQDKTWLRVIACKADHAASSVIGFGPYNVGGLAVPTFTPAGPILPEPQNVTITTASAGAPGAFMCYNAGVTNNPANINDPACTTNGPTCANGTMVSPASKGVTIPVTLPPAGNYFVVKAITCNGSPAGSTVRTTNYQLRPSDPVISPTSTPGYSAPLPVTISLADPLAGVTQTTSPTICYTTNGTSPAFNATCVATANSGTTCTAASSVNLTLDQTTSVNARTCKANYLTGNLATRVYQFAEYTRDITKTAAEMVGGAAGQFLDGENLIATSDAGYGMYLSWTANNVFVGLKGLDLSVNAISHVSSFYLLNPTNASKTTTNDSARSGSTAPLGTAVNEHIACVNGTVADDVTCTRYRYNGTSWVAQADVIAATRSTAQGTLLVTLPRLTFGVNNAGTLSDRLVLLGGLTSPSLVTPLGFPGAGAAFSKWIDIPLNSYHKPNETAFLH